MPIENNKVVAIHYTLTDDDGNVIDSSKGGDALNYLHGHGNIIPGLESALFGKDVGDELRVDVAPADGYGQRYEELVQSVPMTSFEGIEELAVGMRFEAATDQGPVPVVITKIEDGMVTVDGNHELAGVNLHFDVKVESIRDAEKEEIDHGHVH